MTALMHYRLSALYAAEAAHKAGQTEETLAEVTRARRLYHMGVIRAAKARHP